MQKFPKIEQYRHFLKHCKEEGLKEVTIHGTPKIHGTNAAFNFLDGQFLGFQSRNRMITLDDDNLGFVEHMYPHKHDITMMLSHIGRCVVYGEWAGKGIQKGVAVSELDRFFTIFAVMTETGWLEKRDFKDLELPEARIFNINRFPSWELEVDLRYPEITQDRLRKITEEVEQECPVGKHFGISGVGEGLVWSGAGFRFKTKGEKHSASKVKTVAPVDVEKANNVREFVEYAVTESRLKQGIEYLREMGKPVNEKSTGDFLSWLFKDIMSEESDTLEKSGLGRKDIGSAVANKGREWYFNNLED